MNLLLAHCAIADATASALRTDQAILITDGRIERVGDTSAMLAAASRADVHIRDLTGMTVVPGLINMHVHLGLRLPGAAGELLSNETPAARALRMAGNARDALYAGVTTVRLVAESDGTDFDLRRAIEAGHVRGPRIVTAGPGISVTGGHGGGQVADGADAVRRVAREQIAAGADLLKLMASGGIAGDKEKGVGLQFTPEELRAAVDVARTWHKGTTAHAGTPDAIRACIEAGVDGIEHGYALTAELAELMRERGTLYVPTLSVTRCADYFARIGVPDWMAQRALGQADRHAASFRYALEAGVSIAMGTDMLPAERYDGTTATVRELEHMAELGMSAPSVLAAATLVPARHLGIDDQVGTVEAGRMADLLVVAGNPLEDVSVLRDIHMVVKDGDCLPAGSSQ